MYGGKKRKEMDKWELLCLVYSYQSSPYEFLSLSWCIVTHPLHTSSKPLMMYGYHPLRMFLNHSWCIVINPLHISYKSSHDNCWWSAKHHHHHTHLQHHGGDEALDLGSLGLGFLSLFASDGALDHILTHIVLLAQVEQLANLGGTLGAQAAGHRAVGQPGDLLSREGGLVIQR